MGPGTKLRRDRAELLHEASPPPWGASRLAEAEAELNMLKIDQIKLYDRIAALFKTNEGLREKNRKLTMDNLDLKMRLESLK